MKPFDEAISRFRNSNGVMLYKGQNYRIPASRLSYYRSLPKRRLFLNGGSIAISKRPCAIITILGPCVAICLFDEEKKIGGMNHFMLPKDPKEIGTSTRYGDTAYEILLGQMLRAGARRSSLVAMVFGGASVFLNLQDDYASIGKRNCEMAISCLEADGITIVERDLEGETARKITFLTDSGNAIVHTLPKAELGTPCHSSSPLVAMRHSYDENFK